MTTVFHIIRNAAAVVLAAALLIPANAGALSPFVPEYNLDFASGSAEPSAEVVGYVEFIAAHFKADKLKKLIVTGHSDLGEKVTSGVDISEARARIVAALLIDRGIPADAVELRWVQDKEPLIATDQPEPMNRRVCVELVLNSGTIEQILGGAPDA